MADAPPIRRRWFRFGLRTLIVLVTVAAVLLAWISYNLNWIRQRREFWMDDAPIWAFPVFDKAGGPGSLWLFGETSIDTGGLVVVEGENEVEPMRARLSSLFPEAATTVMSRKEHDEYVRTLNP